MVIFTSASQAERLPQLPKMDVTSVGWRCKGAQRGGPERKHSTTDLSPGMAGVLAAREVFEVREPGNASPQRTG